MINKWTKKMYLIMAVFLILILAGCEESRLPNLGKTIDYQGDWYYQGEKIRIKGTQLKFEDGNTATIFLHENGECSITINGNTNETTYSLSEGKFQINGVNGNNLVFFRSKEDSYYDTNEETNIESEPTMDNQVSEDSEKTNSEDSTTPAVTWQDGDVEYYVINTSTEIFHQGSCPIAQTISGARFKPIYSSIEEMMDLGYSPCERCIDISSDQETSPDSDSEPIPTVTSESETENTSESANSESVENLDPLDFETVMNDPDACIDRDLKISGVITEYRKSGDNLIFRVDERGNDGYFWLVNISRDILRKDLFGSTGLPNLKRVTFQGTFAGIITYSSENIKPTPAPLVNAVNYTLD